MAGLIATGGAVAPPKLPAQEKDRVVIVGGGPAGVGTALMLAQRGWKHITVVERTRSITYAPPDKSYVYSIDGRSRQLTDILGLTEKLPEVGVGVQEVILHIQTGFTSQPGEHTNGS
jgi:2-polyprenyl-6-methoxyphenol hydroxylase-like FAD-dependent oxidoreductase